ncbi:hypothetical protein [Streptomyces soliscabiei]|uniref:hypothetical protein n=1 Tax=Streptomyces soliscabiei TaxID=588897 RepID=UPI0029ADBD96|nr:hypothetical protein [Streptomyces sp. NY05-11A]MDX2683494.1 hypothetical protein [Streptomyces sp. NY05-11A]
MAKTITRAVLAEGLSGIPSARAYRRRDRRLLEPVAVGWSALGLTSVEAADTCPTATNRSSECGCSTVT